jgi:hypothetical protein
VALAQKVSLASPLVRQLGQRLHVGAGHVVVTIKCVVHGVSGLGQLVSRSGRRLAVAGIPGQPLRRALC